MTQLITIHGGRGSPRLPSRRRLYAMPYEDAIAALCGLIDDLRDIDGSAGLMNDNRLERAKVRLREMQIGHPMKPKKVPA